MLDVVKFGSDGQAVLVGRFVQVKDSIKKSIQEDEEITRLAEKLRNSVLGITEQVVGSEESGDEEKTDLNMKVSSSLKFVDSHLITCGPNQIIKIGAIVFEEEKEATEGSAAALDSEQRA